MKKSEGRWKENGKRYQVPALQVPGTLCFFFFLFSFFFLSNLNADTKKSPEEERLERRQKVELMGFFLKDPKDAELPQTPMGINLFNQALEYYQKGEYTLSKQAVKDSLAQDSQNPFAYELLGDICNNEQDLKEAKSNYEIAYNLQPTVGLKSKIETLSKEVTVDKKMSTYRDEHFIIKYHNQDKSYEGFELRELLRQAYRNISQDFGYFFNHQIVVQLLDEDEFKALSNTPHWAGGVYDGKIRLPVKKFSYEENELKALSAHEVTHAFVADISSQRVPAWLNEGLAQYEENKYRPINMLVFDSAVKTKTVLSLDQLMNEQALQTKQDALWVHLFYQESFHLTQYLVKRYGMFLVKKMLLEFAANKNTDEVIRNVLQISVNRLENEWRNTYINA